MTILRVNTLGFSTGDKLTTAQINGIDLNPTYALDKRAGETDILSSVVSCALAGRIIPTFALGANANTTYLASGANRIIRVTSAVVANRIYTLGNTDAVAGDELEAFCEASFVTYEVTIKNAVGVTLFILGNLASSHGVWARFRHNGTAWVLQASSSGSILRYEEFTVDGTFIAPSRVTSAMLLGVGAGGGGGPGAFGAVSGNGGGSGGGGAEVGIVTVAISPGTSYAVTVGVGGGSETDGGDTTFSTLATFYGAGRGRAGGVYSAGGLSVASATSPPSLSGQIVLPMRGQGGMSHNSSIVAGWMKGGNAANALGGAGGGAGWFDAPGGGGGASGYPGSVAGVGGDAGLVGGAGTLGAGGGGGGGVNGGPRAGGAGGNGALRVIYVT